MGIPTFSGGFNPITTTQSAQGAAVGGGYVGQSAGGTPVTWRSGVVSTAVANNAAGGGNEGGRVIVSLAGAANTTVDLRSIADLLGTTVILARVKSISFRLLAAADDSVNVTTTPASSVTVGSSGANDWASQANGFGPGATWSFTLHPGGRVLFDCGPDDAAGGLVDATHHLVKITNNDGANTAKVEVLFNGGDS